MRTGFGIFTIILLCSIAWGQAQNGQAQNPSAQTQPGGLHSMPGMDMSKRDMSNMPAPNLKDISGAGSDKDADSDTAAHVMHSMEGHMDMGPHMKMTALRSPKPGDAARAQKVADESRRVAEYYADYHKALADGFEIFLPNVPQKMYHFTNYTYAREAFLHFDPEHPTSLLYEKHGDNYKLIGVMYTAPKSFTEDDLDQRIPLSVAQWHEHVNFCAPPASMSLADKKQEMFGPNAQFGLRGSITTQERCDAAGGSFRPIIFNWMVHVYPFEKDQVSIWSVERQHGDVD